MAAALIAPATVQACPTLGTIAPAIVFVTVAVFTSSALIFWMNIVRCWLVPHVPVRLCLRRKEGRLRFVFFTGDIHDIIFHAVQQPLGLD